MSTGVCGGEHVAVLCRLQRVEHDVMRNDIDTTNNAASIRELKLWMSDRLDVLQSEMCRQTQAILDRLNANGKSHE